MDRKSLPKDWGAFIADELYQNQFDLLLIISKAFRTCYCSILLTPKFKDCDLCYFYLWFVSGSNRCIPLFIREVIRVLYFQTLN